MTNLTDDLDDSPETAAVIANLDLMISIDTSTASLQEAIGKPMRLLNLLKPAGLGGWSEGTALESHRNPLTSIKTRSLG
jgi:hypothetical protein